MNTFDWSMIKNMAKQYRELHPSMPIRKAVKRAHEAYDIFSYAEVKQKDSYYEREINEASMRY